VGSKLNHRRRLSFTPAGGVGRLTRRPESDSRTGGGTQRVRTADENRSTFYLVLLKSCNYTTSTGTPKTSYASYLWYLNEHTHKGNSSFTLYRNRTPSAYTRFFLSRLSPWQLVVPSSETAAKWACSEVASPPSEGRGPKTPLPTPSWWGGAREGTERYLILVANLCFYGKLAFMDYEQLAVLVVGATVE